MSNKEIDIIELTAKIYNILKKWILLYIIFIAIGIGIGLYKLYNTQTYFKSTLIANSNFISNVHIVEYIRSLNIEIKQNNYETSSKKLGIPVEYLKNIKNINSKIIDNTSSNNYVYAKDIGIYGHNCFEIQIEVFDTSNINLITNGIIKYIDNIDYVKATMQNTKQEALKIITKIDEEINEHDSLQTLFFNDDKKNIYHSDNNINIINFLEQKAHYELILNSNSITVMKKFSMSFQTEKLGLSKSIMISILISSLAWLIMIFLLEIRKRVIIYNKSNK